MVNGEWCPLPICMVFVPMPKTIQKMNTKKIALITGGSRGLGRNMAIAIAKKGLDVVITYNANLEAANEVIQEINALGQEAKAFQLDTSNVRQFDKFIEELTGYLKKKYNSPNFDFLINNAGTALYAPVADVTEKQLDDMFNIHFKGVFFLTQKALPFINNGGGIVNISSGLTRISMPGSSVYASAKTAVETLTRYLQKNSAKEKSAQTLLHPAP